ncbi:branched-chain amino acid ABC transporter permease [Candidatus Planktophila dulcis]|uniref:branched-chain amino acid ABC transporter permease n=1 Tax=Candidatus Planktophila dulcis TaxID=1884914 RepID=UPI003BEF3E85
MANLTRFNLRDKGADIWAGWSRPVRTIFVLSMIVLVGLLPFAASWGPTSFLNTPITSFQNVLVYPVGMFILMALGLNIVVGKSGLLDLGYVAFFAIGAYTQGILSTLYGWNTWEIMPFGIGFAMIAGVILGLPALRLRGDYLAIITLGFGEIIRIVAINLSITGGPNGIPGIPNPPSIFGLKFDLMHPQIYFWLVLAMILLVVWMVRRFTVRRPGRAWEAIRQDEDVAALMGVNTLIYKLWSFVIGAAVGGAAGVLYASKVAVISPDMFKFDVSILILACVVFGGIGNIWGVIMGAAILAYLPERIRFISEARQLVFGAVLILMMNLRPDGLLPRKKREKITEKRSM